MIKNKNHERAYNELLPGILALPAAKLLYFAQDFMCQVERLGGSIFLDETGKTKSYHPSLPTEKLGNVFNVAKNDLPSFILSGAPQNVEELLAQDKREALLETMLELGLERRIRTFIYPVRTPAPDYAV